jgi:uncharacterized protein DUF2795
MSAHPTTEELEAAFRGLDYPAPRAKLLTVAHQNGAASSVVDRILALPETADFLNEDELRRTFGVTVHGEHPHGWE